MHKVGWSEGPPAFGQLETPPFPAPPPGGLGWIREGLVGRTEQNGSSNPPAPTFSSWSRVGRLTLLSFLQPPLPAALTTLWRGFQTLLEIPASPGWGLRSPAGFEGQSWRDSSLPPTISWVVGRQHRRPTVLLPLSRGDHTCRCGLRRAVSLKREILDTWVGGAGVGDEKPRRVRGSTSPDRRGDEGAGRGRGCHGSLVAELGELEMPVTDGPFFLFVPLSRPSFFE